MPFGARLESTHCAIDGGAHWHHPIDRCGATILPLAAITAATCYDIIFVSNVVVIGEQIDGSQTADSAPGVATRRVT